VPTYSLVHEFIKQHAADCVIVTGNLRCWCEKLGAKIGCQCYYSEADVENNHVVKLRSILRKEQIVEQYKALGENVVFIGDGNNDLEAMRTANISIATGLTHQPAKSLYAITDYIIFNEKALCRQLNQLL
jgi:phosphoserine phosphatase